ncbi:hypothetical protein N8I74_10950 [Chitiniphilus purpureus]|uniref:Uncharacterized protein n=1 Tax=Chitiniphilus purpureus TaxID=2981137 RepID=A0ABY6DHM2_9NEIS|nr:hypothetical protein [Chitiniphilus sp. CD1]UXY13840.1 hypothetical protein N8I74_10950 [Chitiniphilus sp. CD1]
MQQVQIAGISWYKRENFDRLRAMFKDGHKLHDTYDEWLAAAESGRKELEKRGVRVICVDVDPNEFPAWCASQGLELNAAARNRFASERAYQFVMGEMGENVP